jgi:hypothetical protein
VPGEDADVRIILNNAVAKYYLPQIVIKAKPSGVIVAVAYKISDYCC